MASGGQIRFGVGFNVDKAGLNELKNSLTAISKMTTEQYLDINKGLNINEAQQELNKVKTTVQSVQNALSKSFNADLDSTNLTKFNSELAKSGTSLKQVYSDLSKTGSAGQQAFRKIATQLTTQNTHLKESHRLLNEMATTMANTVKWSVASSAINTLTGSIQKAYSYVRDLDTSLNDIRIVTDKSAESMQKFAKQANDAAKALGKSTTDYTEASLIYYQQGLSEEDVAARAEVTLKAANVTAQSTDEVSEQLTAVWNGYKVSAEEAELYVDKLAAVAASTAADLEELSTGMSKVASAANSMGVDIDELNAQLATIVSVTRQAPESVGTALKTIYARLGDLAVDGEDEFGVALGTVSKTMEKMGIQILDEQGQMREMGDVITETAEKWETWTDAQRQAAAVAMAGKRQYNNLIALFDNWDMYEEALSTSADAAGTLQNQQDIYMESTEAHLKTLKASAEDVYDSIFNAESFNTLLDGLTAIVDTLGTFIDGIGGGGNALLGLSAIFTRVFNKQIASGIMTTVNNFQKMRENAENLKASQQIFQELDEIVLIYGNDVNEVTQRIIEMGQQSKEFEGVISPEAMNNLKEYSKKLDEIGDQQDKFNEAKARSIEALEKSGNDTLMEFSDEDAWKGIRESASLGKARGLSGEDLLAQNKEYKELHKTLTDMTNGYKSSNREASRLVGIQNQLTRTMNRNRNNSSEEAARETQRALNNLREASENFFDNIGEGYQALISDGLLSGETRQRLVDLREAYEEIIESGNDADLGSEAASIALARLVETFEEATEEIQANIQEIDNTATQAALGVEDAFEEAASEINDEFANAIKAATSEKAIQSFVDLAGSVQEVFFAVRAISEIGDIWSDDALTSNEKIQQIIASLAASIPMLITALPGLKENLIGLGGTLKSVAAAMTGGTASAITMTGALKVLLSTLGPIALAFAAISTVVYFAVKAYNADADAAIEAAKAAEHAAEAAKETKAAYDELHNSLTNWSDAVVGLETLTKGTKEYEEALRNANQAALELIKNNPELATHAERDDNGLITFGGADEVLLDKVHQKAAYATSAENLFEVRANEAQVPLLYKKYGFAENNIALNNLINKIIENDNTIAREDVAKAFGTQDEAFIDEMMKNSEALLGLAEEIHGLNETNKLLKEEALRASLDLDEEYSTMTTAEQNAVISIYGEGLTEDEIKRREEEVYANIYQDRVFGFGTENDIQREYAIARGWDPDKTKDKVGDKAVYYDKNGAEQGTISDEDAAKYVAEFKVAEELGQYDEESKTKIKSGVEKVSKAGEKLGEGISEELLGFLTGNDLEFSPNLSPEAVEKIQKDLEGTLSSVSDAEWEAILGEGQGLEDFANTINQALINYDFSAYWANQATEAQAAISQASSALNALYEGEELDEESIQALENEYEHLGEIQDKNSYEYIKALEEIREIEETRYRVALEKEIELGKVQKEKAIEEKKRQLEELKSELAEAGNRGNAFDVAKAVGAVVAAENELSELEQQLEDLTNVEYEIKLSIDEDISSDVDNAFGLANKFEEIGNTLNNILTDDLKISLDDAKNYIDAGLGDMLLNAEDTTDGMMQLNAESVKAFIEGKKAELESDRKAKLEQLYNEREILNAQKEALVAKLTALDEAYTAENKIDAKSALKKAQNAEIAYQAEVIALNEETKKVAEAVTEEQNINSQLYTALGGMYEQDSTNLQQAEIDATNTNKREIDTRIGNVEQLHSAYRQLAEQVAASEEGNDLGALKKGKTSRGGVTITTGSKEVTGKGDIEAEAILAEELDKLLEDMFPKDDDSEDAEIDSEYQHTIQAAKDDAQRRIDALEVQIGSVDGAIAALISSEGALDDLYDGIGNGANKAKEDNQDFVDTLEEIYDRYYDINIQLDLLETNLSRVQKQQEKLTGKGYIQNLQQQLDILNKQIEANKTKLSLTEQEMTEVMAALQMKGASFNEEGQVTNYKAVIDAALAEANAVIATYNSMSGEQQEAYKATMESAKESYDALVSTFERFDDLYTEEIPGLIDTIQEALDQAVELKIEQFNTEIQITLDMRQAEREWNDFYANVLNNLKDDDLVGQVKLGATQFGTYYGDGGSTVATDIAKLEALNEQAAQMLNGKFATTYGDNYAKLYEDLIAANEQLMTDMEAAQGIADGIYDNYLSSIDKVIEGNDAVIEQYEYINGLLDHNVKLIELMGADEKSSMLTDQYAQRNALNQQMIKDHYANTQYYEQMMNSIDDKTSEEWQKWSEAWQSEVTALNNSIITAMEDAAAAYANAIDIAMQEMESAFTDGMGFSYIQDEWDLVNENAEMYLDTINSAYEISSLENKFAEAINSTESLSAQKKLRAAMEEELKILEEADQVSQYDIDRANLKYELTLKQIALEEAQNNKSTMKLRRDSQGNMSYVFAADQDEVSKAQQELAEAENELYNFDKDAYKEKTSAILKAEQDLQSKLKDIWNDESLTQKQKEEYAAMVSEQYRKIIDANISESEKTKQNLSDDTLSILMKNYQEELDKAIETANGEEEATRIAVEEMQKKFKGLVDESNPDSFINAMNELSQNWGDGTFAPGTFTGNLSSSTQSLVDNIQSSFRTGLSTISSGFAGEGGEYPSLVEVISGAMGKCKTAAEEFGNTVGNIATAAGITTLKDQTDGLNGSTDTLKATMLLLLQANTDYIVKVTGKEGTLEAAKNLAEQYRQQHIEITNVNTSMTNYLKKLEDMKAKAEAAAKAARDLSTALKTQTSAQKNTGGGSSGVGQASSTNTATVNSGGGSSAPTTTQNVDNRSQEEKDGGKYGTWTAHYDAKGAKDNTYPPQTYTGWAYQVGSASGTYPVGIAKRKGGTRFGWVSGFDTGGYTGEWGDDGKLAVLHEKEIVLNKTDTSNLLDIVSMVREMTSNSLQGANGMLSGMIEALASVTNNSNSTSQTIHITAEFPGVKVASEIEEAFNNLANIASQHAFQY